MKTNIRKKISSELRNLIEQERIKEDSSSVKIFVQFKGDCQLFSNLGFRIESITGNFVSGTILLKDIPELAALENLIYTEKAHKVKPLLDKSIPEIKADQVWSFDTSINSWKGITGKGVVIGIVDSGINYLHQSFQKLDKKTRISAIWDMSLTPKTLDDGTIESGPSPFGGIVLPKGVEYLEGRINQAIESNDPFKKVRHKDTDGHGSHVSGIAAGNGFQDDTCADVRDYIGVAPEAEIIFVKLDDWDGDEILNGVKYIFDKAGAKPAVVNLSLGGTSGAHDGSLSYEKSIDSILSGSTKRAVVAAAGNEADLRLHYSAKIPKTGNHEFSFHVKAEDKEKRYLEIWYDDPHRLSISITPASDTSKGPVGTADDIKVYEVKGKRKLTINLDNNETRNNDNQIFITLNPDKGGTNLAGEWKIKLFNGTANDVPFHCWIRDSVKENDFKYPQFNKTDAIKTTTINNPASANHIIAVGSYITKGSNKGTLASSSCQGPTRDNRTKPEITAPGKAITSARGETPGCCEKFWCWCCKKYHVEKEGTSMAAPHVTGAIALMLQKKPNLSVNDIRLNLAASAKTDTDTGVPPNSNQWGFGKLDIKAALNLVPTPVSSGGGSSSPFMSSPPIVNSNLEISQNTTTSLPSDFQLRNIYNNFMNTSKGKFYSELAEKYANEIWMLVNNNKRVATIWHRNGGKKMISLATGLLANPTKPIPTVIDELSMSTRLENIASIFKKYGSDMLKKDITKVYEELSAYFGRSINQIIQQFELDDLQSNPKI